MREISTAALIGWSRRFPATPEQAGEARRFLAAILDGHPAGDAILCLSELVTNATIHSRSAQPGGCLTVRVQRRDDHCAWRSATRADPGLRSAHEDGDDGRGLLIVDRLASTWGRSGNAATGWITWFEMDPCS